MSIDGRPSGTQLSDRVAEEIRAVLARRRVSSRELARRLEVSPSWISYRLTGAQNIDLNDLERIAGALEVEVVDLLPRAVAEIGRTLGYHQPTASGRVLPPGRPPNRPTGRASGPGRTSRTQRSMAA